MELTPVEDVRERDPGPRAVAGLFPDFASA
jgi:hypothetical protein